MLSAHEIVAFVGTATPSRAKDFYRNTLGLRLVSEDGFALVFDAGGRMLRVAIVPEVRPAGYTVLGWKVPDIERVVRGLVQRSLVFRRYAGLEQDELGIWSAPSGARVAWFEDPDGNTLSLTEFEQAPTRRRSTKRPARKSSKRRGRRT